MISSMKTRANIMGNDANIQELSLPKKYVTCVKDLKYKAITRKSSKDVIKRKLTWFSNSDIEYKLPPKYNKSLKPTAIPPSLKPILTYIKKTVLR